MVRKYTHILINMLYYVRGYVVFRPLQIGRYFLSLRRLFSHFMEQWVVMVPANRANTRSHFGRIASMVEPGYTC